MRNSLRFILRRNYARSSIPISRDLSHFQVQTNANLHTFRYFCAVLCRRVHHNLSSSGFSSDIAKLCTRNFSSELAVEHKELDHAVLTDIFSKPGTPVEVKNELDSNNIIISHELVLKVLQDLEGSPDNARRFFEWLAENENERLSSKSYNLMLGILGVNGFVTEFWDMIGLMKTKGYGVSKSAYNKVADKFEKEGLENDLEKLRDVFTSKNANNSLEKACSRISKIIRQDVWSDDVEGKLRDSGITFSSELVAMVLTSLNTEPMKALIFFRWIAENCSLQLDARTYNAMVTVLSREDCIEKFWRVVKEMENVGFEIEKETYIKVLGRLLKRKMIDEAVNFYEFAMTRSNKPPTQDCTLLLRKIVVSKEIDMELFSRVIKVYIENGNSMTNSTLNAVFKSLKSVGRVGCCNKILNAMGQYGFVANTTLQSKIGFQLSSTGRNEETAEFINQIKSSGLNPDQKTWESLIEGYCVARKLDKASDCFKQMVESEGVSSAGYACELLANAYCHKNRAIDAFHIFTSMVNEKDLKPWHSTYKTLISNLLAQGGFSDALSLLGLMKNHGFPPFLDPFIGYVSKRGSSDEAITFLKAVSAKRFPSKSVFIRIFEAFFKVKRHSEAQNFLSKCPGYIRNNADILNLFYFAKCGDVAGSSSVAA